MSSSYYVIIAENKVICTINCEESQAKELCEKLTKEKGIVHTFELEELYDERL